MCYIQNGYKVIFDLGRHQFQSDVVKVQKNCFSIKRNFNGMYSSPQTVDMYVCQKMWFSIELLAEIQRKFFIHCKEARIDATQLHSVIEHAERIYVDLKLSPEVITAIKSIEKGLFAILNSDHTLNHCYRFQCMCSFTTEPIAATSVLEQMQLYRDKWTREQRLYEEVTCNATELKVDVDELRVQDVSEQNTPRTQMGTEKGKRLNQGST